MDWQGVIHVTTSKLSSSPNASLKNVTHNGSCSCIRMYRYVHQWHNKLYLLPQVF